MHRTSSKNPGKKEIRIRAQVKEIEDFLKLQEENPVQLNFTLDTAFPGIKWNEAKNRVAQKFLDETEAIIRKMSEEKGIPLNDGSTPAPEVKIQSKEIIISK